MQKPRVLFVCVHNSARSQMAEEYLRKFADDKFEVFSAGLEPGKINPFAAKVLKEDGIDISNKKTNSVFEFYKEGKMFSYVITVCDESNSERCPIFPGRVNRLHWSFEDPASFTGSEQEILEQTRKVREKIKIKINEFIKNFD